MRRTIGVVLLLLAGRGLSAQTATIRWEYGMLATVSNHPFIWNTAAGDSVLGNPQQMLTAQNSNKEFLAFLDAVGAQGWELITSEEHGAGTTYLFKRRR